MKSPTFSTYSGIMSNRSAVGIESDQRLRRLSYAGLNAGLSLVRPLIQHTNTRHTHTRHTSLVDQTTLKLNTTVTSSGSNASNNSSVVNIHHNSNKMLPTSYDHIVMPMRTNIDNSRVNRRVNKSAQESFTCSQQSILSAMDRFVKSVLNMDSTVLVPSRLRDMDIESNQLQQIPSSLANTDLHSFYLMLNDVKKELLWGHATTTTTVASTNLVPISGRSSPRELKHIRQPSDDSLGSLESTPSTCSDQDTDSEADSLQSVQSDRDSIDEHTSHLAAAFRLHLQGLHSILHELADSADYLSSRYQEEIDASSL